MSGVAIYWPWNEQWTKCMPNASNSCPHSHVKRLNIEGWIKLKQKQNVEAKLKCAMWNEQINGLATNHSPATLHKQKQMRALDVEEMESSSKIDLRDVLWCKSIKNACRFGASIIARLSKERCISLVTEGRPFHVTPRQNWSRWGPFNLKNIFLQNGSIKNTKPRA